MKADKYTKFILTVIAVNLSILTFKNLNLMPKAYANEPINKLDLTPNLNYGLVPLNEDGSIDVNVKSFNPSSVMDVNIEEVGGYNTYGKIPVKIKDQPIEVEIEDQPIEVEID
jgi:hypothetical protein